jgi:peptide/nickel transport system ATP-binding protein
MVITKPLLEVRSLSVIVKNRFTAVNDVSFEIKPGEIVGIVGESGCGKTLTARSIPALLPQGVKLQSGSIIFNGADIHNLTEKELYRLRGKELSMIFQEPMSALNPLLTIGRQIGEALELHGIKDKNFIKEQTLDVMCNVGLAEADKLMSMYPHQISGGMRQRVMIALSVINKPKLLIADEPTTALDVITQEQILRLLEEINSELGTAILFISHDLEVIKRICDRVLVMYYGKLVEEGNTGSIFSNPKHEYTKGLLGSMPSVSQKGKALVNIPGQVPSLEQHSERNLLGCPFAPRCGKAEDVCGSRFPDRTFVGEEHSVHCAQINKGV